MRIGELAAMAGVTTRTVRHYHRVGLLPEPERRANGYREYGLRDAVALARVRRLTELGLSLEEVRDALLADAGKDLREILVELDTDLARQQEAIGQRRARLAELVRRAESGGGLPPEGPVSPELAALFDTMARAFAHRATPEPAMAAKERELLAFLDASGDQGHRDWLLALTHALSGEPDAMARAHEIYVRLDALTDADPDDPRVEALAQAVADSMPDSLARAMSGQPQEDRGGFAEALFADYPPAQAEVLRRATRLLRERGRP